MNNTKLIKIYVTLLEEGTDKSNTLPMDKDVFLILDEFFSDVDRYSDDVELHRDYPCEYLTETELRNCAQKTLDRLGRSG